MEICTNNLKIEKDSIKNREGYIMQKIKQIKTEEEYEQILKRIKEIFDSKPETPEGNELDYLVGLVEKYEDEIFPSDAQG